MGQDFETLEQAAALRRAEKDARAGPRDFQAGRAKPARGTVDSQRGAFPVAPTQE
jgi:hypothetical protein